MRACRTDRQRCFQSNDAQTFAHRRRCCSVRLALCPKAVGSPYVEGRDLGALCSNLAPGARPVPTPLFSLVNPVATQTPTENNTVIMREPAKGVDRRFLHKSYKSLKLNKRIFC